MRSSEFQWLVARLGNAKSTPRADHPAAASAARTVQRRVSRPTRVDRLPGSVVPIHSPVCALVATTACLTCREGSAEPFREHYSLFTLALSPRGGPCRFRHRALLYRKPVPPLLQWVRKPRPSPLLRAFFAVRTLIP